MKVFDERRTQLHPELRPRPRVRRRRTIGSIVAGGLALAIGAIALTHAGDSGVAGVGRNPQAALDAAKRRAAAAAHGPSIRECLAHPNRISMVGTYSTEFRDAIPTDGTTYDARNTTFTGYPSQTLYPFGIGKQTAPRRLCVLGGLVRGDQSRRLTWDEMKLRHDGDALRIAGNDWYLVDGLRADNIEDGVAPRGTDGLYPKDGDGFVLRNLYMTYVRDDCVENDDIAGGVIYDSLFDGCYTGISERPTDGNEQWNHRAPANETLTLDRVLLRLQAMPGPYESNNRSILGHGQLFKWSRVAHTRIVIRNSIFFVERKPNSTSSFPFPPGTVTQNVTIVWGGKGAFTWEVPAGTTVTPDRGVWDTARAKWLSRHGCTSFDSCTKLTTPDPA